jgi:hypothetical protein
MKKIAVAAILLLTVILTACSSTYNIKEMGIDKESHPGWSADLRNSDDHEYMYVRYNGRTKSEPLQRMTYMVFGSSAEAKDYYKYWIDYCDGSAEVYDKGKDWFITRLPDTYDVIITSMFYREGNIIICANVEVTTYSTLGDSSTTNNSDLKQYVTDNHMDIRKSVLEMLEKSRE